jgi:hypothetical protein
MLQGFSMDLAKVDRDVAYIAVLYTYVANFCCQCFICFFQMYVTSVFIWMLHMFCTYVFKCFIWMLRCVAMFFKCFMCFL